VGGRTAAAAAPKRKSPQKEKPDMYFFLVHKMTVMLSI